MDMAYKLRLIIVTHAGEASHAILKTDIKALEELIQLIISYSPMGNNSLKSFTFPWTEAWLLSRFLTK